MVPQANRSVLGTVVCAVLLGALFGCEDSVRIQRVQRSPAESGFPEPAQVWLDVRGVGKSPAEVSFEVEASEVAWLFESSLKLARWNPDSNALEALDSHYDPESGRLVAHVEEDGLHAVIGLSRILPILHAQLQVAAMSSPSWQPHMEPPDCNQILCGFDTVIVAMPEGPIWIPSDSLEGVFGDICDLCLGSGEWPSNMARYDWFNPMLDWGMFPSNELCELLDWDVDQDGLNDGQELCVSQTSPTLADTDGDGLLDDWEVNGTSVGTLLVDLPALGVNPLKRDLLLEIDWMEVDLNNDGNVYDLRPMDDARSQVEAVFENQGIHLIIHSDSSFKTALGEVWQEHSLDDVLYNRDRDGISDFTAVYDSIMMKNASSASLAGLSRYCLWIDSFDSTSCGGVAERLDDFVFSNRFIVSLGPLGGGAKRHQVSTLLHELGHTLQLYHGGDPEFTYTPLRRYEKKYEPNYPSVMNGFHSAQGVTGYWLHYPLPNNDNSLPGTHVGILRFVGPAFDERVFDYSHGERDDIDETHLTATQWTQDFGFTDPVGWGNYGELQGSGVWKVNLQSDSLKYKFHMGDPWLSREMFNVQTDHDDWTHMRLKNWE
jgi:hypothetical protein